ncbi:MAG: ferrous iron transport protein A [Candidatus Cloacimonetes bacterium]|nr:ferrous iron transport protein A [Candidatus Cloacimonadota bacterium]
MKFGGGHGKGRHCRRLLKEQRHLQDGSSYKITGYRGENCEFRRKLLNLGLFRGEDFRVMGRAPMGDPIEIKINGYRLSIRAAEADELITEKIENEK